MSSPKTMILNPRLDHSYPIPTGDMGLKDDTVSLNNEILRNILGMVGFEQLQIRRSVKLLVFQL